LEPSFFTGGNSRFGAKTQENCPRNGKESGVIRDDGQDGGSPAQGNLLKHIRVCHRGISTIVFNNNKLLSYY